MIDTKMKEKMIEEMKKIDLDENMIDDKLVWGAKKIMFGIAKVKWSLKENDIDDDKAKEILKKMVDMIIEKDMSEAIEKMHSHWHDSEGECC